MIEYRRLRRKVGSDGNPWKPKTPKAIPVILLSNAFAFAQLTFSDFYSRTPSTEEKRHCLLVWRFLPRRRFEIPLRE